MILGVILGIVLFAFMVFCFVMAYVSRNYESASGLGWYINTSRERDESLEWSNMTAPHPDSW